MNTKDETALAYHEAGHAILALYLEFTFTEASIVENSHSLGRVLIDKFHLPIDCENDDQTRALLDRYIQVTLAGPIAESKYTGKRSKYDINDIEKCIGFIIQYWGGIAAVQQTYFDFMKALTASRFLSLNARGKEIGSSLWKKVEQVAKKLIKDKTLSFEDIEKIYYK